MHLFRGVIRTYTFCKFSPVLILAVSTFNSLACFSEGQVGALLDVTKTKPKGRYWPLPEEFDLPVSVLGASSVTTGKPEAKKSIIVA